jgi:hypothetical protein
VAGAPRRAHGPFSAASIGHLTMDLKKRIVGILTNPAAEWSVIAAEPATIELLYRNYILILALFPALGMFLAVGLFSPIFALRAAVGTYVSSVVLPVVVALIIERLAPRFKSGGDTVRALKLVAYAATPVWLAGILYATIILSPLVLIAAIYAAYLFYVGLGPLLQTPLEQRVPFTVMAALMILVASIVLNFLTRLLGLGGGLF